MDFLSAAKPYVRLGFKVLPLKPGSKEASTPNGVYDATDGITEIEKWGLQCPEANIAVGCGPDSGICVLDVDKQHGGINTLKELQHRYGDLPMAPMQRTPQGGFHMFFAYDKRIGNSVGSKTNGLGPGLDVKSKGGYVVLAPSYWDGYKRGKLELPGGGHYVWIKAPLGTHLPTIPGWMIDILMPKPLPPFTRRQIEMGDATIAQVVQALEWVSNHDYGVWIKMGMAVKSAFGDGGYDVWRNWSGAGYSEFSDAECQKKWASFKRTDGVNIGSVFYEARAAGADLSKIFKERKAT